MAGRTHSAQGSFGVDDVEKSAVETAEDVKYAYVVDPVAERRYVRFLIVEHANTKARR